MSAQAKELIAALVRHIEGETCSHEETHRGGALWEICDMCGQQWADDRGGKPDFQWPEAVEKARIFLDGREDEPFDGLTKREVFALHATQPGVAEIVATAGLHCRDGHNVWSDAQTRIGTFNEWWGGLSNSERFALFAKVKVQEADAMLAALAEPQP